MKKILACMLLIAMLLTATGAMASQFDPLVLYTSYSNSAQFGNGHYTYLTMDYGVLYSGPGEEYTSIGEFEMNDRYVRCYCLAYGLGQKIWVLIDFTDYGTPWRGYVPLSEFEDYRQENMLRTLPFETPNEILTPSMIAQLYLDCNGKWGPGNEYIDHVFLNARNVEGTLVLSQGDWGLLELNENTVQNMGLYGKCRVWVSLSNCMY